MPAFDDRDGYVWMDGEFLPHRDAKVHVLTHALHYASSVFEGERAYGGVVFKSREHSQRLQHTRASQNCGCRHGQLSTPKFARNGR